MISANFGPSSGNPRERRAYTHALIDKAQRTGAVEDFAVAAEQVAKVEAGEMPRKTRNARFIEALTGVAMADSMVNRVVTVGNDLLKNGKRNIVGLLKNGERNIVGWVDTEENPKYLVSASLASPSFDLAPWKGAIMTYGAVVDPATGYEEPYKLSVRSRSGSDGSGNRTSHPIPYATDPETGTHSVDAVRLSQARRDERIYLALQAARIPTSGEYSAADTLPQERIDDIMNMLSR